MSESENTKVVQEAYQCFKQGKMPELLGLMVEGVEWRLPAIENVPISGARVGRSQVAEFFATLAETQEALQFEPQSFVAQGDKVVALGQYEWRVKKTGRAFKSSWVHVFTLRDGKVVGFVEHFDTAQAVAAYRA